MIIAFVAYLAALAVIALTTWRQTTDAHGFYLGGRRLPPWLAALSAGASDMSGWLLLGLPGLAYVAGGEAMFMASGLLVGTWLNWRIIAGPLCAASRDLDHAVTLPEFLARRFGGSRALQVVAAVPVLFFFIIYTSAGLVAGGKLFEVVLAIPYDQAVITGAAIILAYTCAGGFLAVCWTDALQALMMGCALVAVPLTATLVASPAVTDSVVAGAASGSAWSVEPVAALSALAWGLGYCGQPHILARFMALRSPAEAPQARRIAVTWSAVALTGAVAVGIGGAMVVTPEALGADPERIFIFQVASLFPAVIAGACLAAVLAAIMSTADSQLLVAAAALSHDLIGSGPDSRRGLLAGRVAVVAICLIATALALNPDPSVLELVAYAWAGFGATLGPTLIGALHWPGMTRAAAFAGIVTGGSVVVGWRSLDGGIFAVYELLPAFIASLLVVTAFTFLASGAGGFRRARWVGPALGTRKF